MNDLPNCLCNSKVILLADDTTLYASLDNIVILYDLLNRDLDNLTHLQIYGSIYLNVPVYCVTLNADCINYLSELFPRLSSYFNMYVSNPK